MTFRIENYVSPDKRTLINSYKVLKDRLSVENRKSVLGNSDFQPDMNQSFNDKIGDSRLSLAADTNDAYYPRIFGIASGNVTLELYIGIQNKKHCLILEVFK